MKMSELRSQVDVRVELVGDITPESIQKTFNQIYEQWKISKTKPILLVLSSEGGSVSAALALWDALKIYGIEIYTLAIGGCSSAAALILQIGKKRLATSQATLMFHEPTFYNLSGKLSDLDANIQTAKRILETWIELVAGRVGGTEKEKLREMFRTDHYFSAEEAKKLNFIDDIVEPD